MVSKLQLNHPRKLRHYWYSKEAHCECDCRDRLNVRGALFCAIQLREILNSQGYALEKNYNSGTVGSVVL